MDHSISITTAIRTQNVKHGGEEFESKSADTEVDRLRLNANAPSDVPAKGERRSAFRPDICAVHSGDHLAFTTEGSCEGYNSVFCLNELTLLFP